jgi:hypothetical protein
VSKVLSRKYLFSFIICYFSWPFQTMLCNQARGVNIHNTSSVLCARINHLKTTIYIRVTCNLEFLYWLIDYRIVQVCINPPYQISSGLAKSLFIRSGFFRVFKLGVDQKDNLLDFHVVDLIVHSVLLGTSINKVQFKEKLKESIVNWAKIDDWIDRYQIASYTEVVLIYTAIQLMDP